MGLVLFNNEDEKKGDHIPPLRDERLPTPNYHTLWLFLLRGMVLFGEARSFIIPFEWRDCSETSSSCLKEVNVMYIARSSIVCNTS